MTTKTRFKQLRLKAGITQLELAVLSGLSNGMICRFERGQNDITLDNLMLLLDKIGSSPAELFASKSFTLPLLELDNITAPVGEVVRCGDYKDCYAVINRKQSIYPIDSITIINPTIKARTGDVIAYLNNDGVLCYELLRTVDSQYIGVVVETEWNYKRI